MTSLLRFIESPTMSGDAECHGQWNDATMTTISSISPDWGHAAGSIAHACSRCHGSFPGGLGQPAPRSANATQNRISGDAFYHRLKWNWVHGSLGRHTDPLYRKHGDVDFIAAQQMMAFCGNSPKDPKLHATCEILTPQGPRCPQSDPL